MKKVFLILGVILLLVSGFFIYQYKKYKKVDNSKPNNEKTTYTDKVYTFSEGDRTFTVQYNEDGDLAKVSYDRNQYELKSVISASGARYANQDESVIFWEHQNEAILEINKKEVFTNAKLIENKQNQTNIYNPFNETKWKWVNTKYTDGQIIKPNEPDAFVIYFRDGNSFSSTTDCNSIMGSFIAESPNLSFDNMASTKMACPDKKTQEEIYTSMLADVKRFKLDGQNNTLELELNGYKSGIMYFTKNLE